MEVYKLKEFEEVDTVLDGWEPPKEAETLQKRTAPEMRAA